MKKAQGNKKSKMKTTCAIILPLLAKHFKNY